MKQSDIIRTLPGADKETGLYVDNSVEAGDGIMYDVDPSLWGQYFWATIHLTAFGYPDAPSNETKQAVFNQFDSYRFSLLCGACREHYRDNLQQYPLEEYLDSRDSLIQWTILIHSKVNESLGKPAFDFSAYLNKLMGEEVVVFADENGEPQLIDDESAGQEQANDAQDDIQTEAEMTQYSNNQSISEGDATVGEMKQEPSQFLSARSVSGFNDDSRQNVKQAQRRPTATDKALRPATNARKSLPAAQKDKHARLQQHSDAANVGSHRAAANTSSRLAVSHAHRIQQQMSRSNVVQQQQRSSTSRSRTRSPPPPGSRLAALVNARNRGRPDPQNKSLTPSSFSRPSATSIKHSSSRQQTDSLYNARFKRPAKECENCTKSVMKPSSF